MKKTLLYSLAALASISLASCTGDYDDWASPQSNAQEEAKNVTLNITPGAAVNFTGMSAEKVKFFNASITAPDNMTATSYQVEVELTDKDGNAVKKTLNADVDGQVATADLKAAVEEVCGKYPTDRTVKTVAKANLKCDNGEAFYALSNQVDNHVTPESFGTAYKLVYNDGEAEYDMTTSEADYPAFKLAVEAEAGSTFEVLNAEGDAVNEGRFTEDAKYNVTFDAQTGSVKAEKAPLELYMTGSAFGNWQVWHQLTPIFGSDDQFWTITYLTEGDEFKFSPDAGWKGQDFGYPATTIKDKAGAILTDNGGNFAVGKSGWYLLHVTNGTSKTLEILEPNVYLMGDAAGEWSIAESHKFTIPATKDEPFVSPAFAKDAELRMCVFINGTGIEGYNWWGSEFIIINGKIEYRGKGGDQARLNVSKDQKAYLNFTDGTGEIK